MRARDMPTVDASTSPEWTSPSESWRRSAKPRGGSTCLAALFQHTALDLILLDRFE